MSGPPLSFSESEASLDWSVFAVPDSGRSVVHDVAREAPALEEPEASPVEIPDHLEERVDLVIEDHRVVLAELEARARESARSAGFTQPLGAPEVPKVQRRAWDPKEVHLDERVLQDRRERERLLRELDPGVVRPPVDPPIVTRLGVFRVAPEFFQVKGLDRRADARLLREGVTSAEAFLAAQDSHIARLTGLSLADVDRAKADLDLTRLPGVRKDAADLLRLAGVHSVSALAETDPAVLSQTIEALRVRHRFIVLPEVLSSERAVATLVADAQGRT